MNILNVGIPELLLFGVILLVIFGPDRLQGEAKKAARIVRAVIRSETYREIAALVQAFRAAPQRVMREVQLEEIEKEIASFEDCASASAGTAAPATHSEKQEPEL